MKTTKKRYGIVQPLLKNQLPKISKMLVEFQENTGTSRKKIAKYLDVPITTLTRIEDGRHKSVLTESFMSKFMTLFPKCKYTSSTLLTEYVECMYSHGRISTTSYEAYYDVQKTIDKMKNMFIPLSEPFFRKNKIRGPL